MIRLIEQDDITQLILDRGAARNAVPIAAWDAIAEASAVLARSAAAVVVVQSAMTGMFSAGADLSEFSTLIADPAQRSRFRNAMAAAIAGLAALPMPVIAAVDGGCFGAAVAVTLACDIVIAGDGARFATTPAKLGIGYPAGDVARLRARVGAGQAARMLFTGARIDPDEAMRIGLAQVRAPDAGAAALAMAASIAGNDGDAVRLLKSVLRDPAAPGNDAAFEGAFGSPGFARRLHDFLAGKR